MPTNLPKLLFVENAENILVSTQKPVETWINVDDISWIEISCARTPSVRIRLRSDPNAKIWARGASAAALIATLRGGKRGANK